MRLTTVAVGSHACARRRLSPLRGCAGLTASPRVRGLMYIWTSPASEATTRRGISTSTEAHPVPNPRMGAAHPHPSDANGSNSRYLESAPKHPSFSMRIPAEHRGVRPRAGTRATARSAGAGRARRRRSTRRFEFVRGTSPWSSSTPCAACWRCGVRVEALPWATGKHRDAYAWFSPGGPSAVVAGGRRGVPQVLGHRLSGRAHGSTAAPTNIEAIGGRCAGRKIRSTATASVCCGSDANFDIGSTGSAPSAALYFVCSDMWALPEGERAGQAVQVLDRFHIMSHFSQAIDEVRAEARVHSRWLLKRPEISPSDRWALGGAARGSMLPAWLRLTGSELRVLQWRDSKANGEGLWSGTGLGSMPDWNPILRKPFE